MLLPLVDRVLVQRAQVAPARVVEQERDAVEAIGCVLYRASSAAKSVTSTTYATPPISAAIVLGALGDHVEHGDAGALFREAPARRRADPGATPRHDRSVSPEQLPVELLHAATVTRRAILLPSQWGG